MKIVLTLAALLIATATLSACNTVNGVGKDVESVGKKIQQ